MNQTPTRDSGGILESVLAKGDLGKLTSAERLDYYRSVCQSIGLNPLTRPLEFISLQGKLTLYARRDAADQLRKINGVSIEIVERSVMDGLYIVHVRAKDASGRTDEDLGVVTIAGLKGEAAANAMLKAVTKAKRRITLSISGLGFLDETEVADIAQEPRKSSAQEPRKSSAQAKRDGDWERLEHELADCSSAVTVDRLQRVYERDVYPGWKLEWREQANEAFEKRRGDFGLAPGEAATLREQLTESLIAETEASLPDIPPFLDRRQPPEGPATRAEYVQAAHEAIETFTGLDSLRPWWEREAPARKRFSLNQAEIDGLKERLAAKRHEILQKLEAKESSGK